MKTTIRLFVFFCVLPLLAGTASGGNVPPSPCWLKNGKIYCPGDVEVTGAIITGDVDSGADPVFEVDEDGNVKARSVVIGTPVAAINVAKAVWEVKDSNGDVVASQTVTCTNITDGAQACAVKTYVMIAGTLTLVQTLDSAP